MKKKHSDTLIYIKSERLLLSSLFFFIYLQGRCPLAVNLSVASVFSEMGKAFIKASVVVNHELHTLVKHNAADSTKCLCGTFL